MIAVFEQYISEIIAGIAVVLAAVANMRVVRSERKAELTNQLARRMELLVEVERKESAFRNLEIILMKKILLLEKHPELLESPSQELKRLYRNLASVRGFQQRSIAREEIEKKITCRDAKSYYESLTSVQRLRLKITSDVEVESNHYEELFANLSNNAA